MTPNHIKILYTLNALFFCALIVLFMYKGTELRQPTRTSLYPGSDAGVLSDASTTAAVAKVVVGNNTDDPAAKKLGTITQISGSALTLKDQISGDVYAVSISATTKVELLGSRKDPAVYQKELDAYYAQVKLLMEDPLKNKAALGALTLPVPVESKPGTLADLAVGDSVLVKADSAIAGKTVAATMITKAAPLAQ